MCMWIHRSLFCKKHQMANIMVVLGCASCSACSIVGGLFLHSFPMFFPPPSLPRLQCLYSKLFKLCFGDSRAFQTQNGGKTQQRWCQLRCSKTPRWRPCRWVSCYNEKSCQHICKACQASSFYNCFIPRFYRHGHVLEWFRFSLWLPTVSPRPQILCEAHTKFLEQGERKVRVSDDERCHFVVPLVQHKSYPPVLTDTFKDYHFRCSAFELNLRILKTNSTESWRRAKRHASFSHTSTRQMCFARQKNPWWGKDR